MVPAPSAQRYSSGCSSGHMVVTARQPRRPSRKAGRKATTPTARPRQVGGVTLTNTRRHSHLPPYGWTAGPTSTSATRNAMRFLREVRGRNGWLLYTLQIARSRGGQGTSMREVGAGCVTSRSLCSFAPRLERMDSIFRPPTLRLALQTLHCGHADRSYRGGLHASHAASR